MKTVCKKLLSLMLVAVLLVSAVPMMASAASDTISVEVYVGAESNDATYETTLTVTPNNKQSSTVVDICTWHVLKYFEENGVAYGDFAGAYVAGRGNLDRSDSVNVGDTVAAGDTVCLIEAMKNKDVHGNSVEDIKARFMECDFLLIDDIQRMKQSASQEIFFNLYNKLIAENKQIIITSDIHPSELKGIENRLISRFLSGLKVRVGSPEFETAKAILKKKIEGRNESIMIEDEVLDFIATKFSSDVRKLEGSLNELFFKAILENPGIIDLSFAQAVFSDEPIIVVEEDLSIGKIKACVCEYYGLTKSQIESKSRTKQISNARHIAVYICRKHLQVPFVKIGFSFGNRDHSTIMSSYEKAKKMIAQDPLFKTAVEQIEAKLGIR